MSAGTSEEGTVDALVFESGRGSAAESARVSDSVMGMSVEDWDASMASALGVASARKSGYVSEASLARLWARKTVLWWGKRSEATLVASKALRRGGASARARAPWE